MTEATVTAVQPRPAPPTPPATVWWTDPRYQIAFLITLVLVVGQLKYSVLGGYDRLATALATCVATEAILSLLIRGKVVNLQSAYISGISMSLLTKPHAGILWPFAVGGFLAISSKYVLQYRNQHLWNPTNFAISALLLIAPNSVSPLSQQFGNDLATNAIIWTFGLLIVTRVRVVHITLTYMACFLILAGARAAAFNLPLLPEIAPITGPMYQLFLFFMITDPRTVVKGKKNQLIVVGIIALLEAVFRSMASLSVPMPEAFVAAPSLLALAIVGPIAKFIEVSRMAPARPRS